MSHSNMQAKSDRLINFARQVGLNINISKTQVMLEFSTLHLSSTREPLEDVEEPPTWAALSIQTVQKDFKSRFAKYQSAFSQLCPIWRSRQYNLKTKMMLYNSNVKSVLLYGSECRRVVRAHMRTVEAFHKRVPQTNMSDL